MVLVSVEIKWQWQKIIIAEKWEKNLRNVTSSAVQVEAKLIFSMHKYIYIHTRPPFKMGLHGTQVMWCFASLDFRQSSKLSFKLRREFFCLDKEKLASNEVGFHFEIWTTQVWDKIALQEKSLLARLKSPRKNSNIVAKDY